jgi:hypothetical protein
MHRSTSLVVELSDGGKVVASELAVVVVLPVSVPVLVVSLPVAAVVVVVVSAAVSPSSSLLAQPSIGIAAIDSRKDQECSRMR